MFKRMRPSVSGVGRSPIQDIEQAARDPPPLTQEPFGNDNTPATQLGPQPQIPFDIMSNFPCARKDPGLATRL